MTKDEAMAWGLTGPCARASGIKAGHPQGMSPTSATPTTGMARAPRLSSSRSPSCRGDCYARYYVRLEE